MLFPLTLCFYLSLCRESYNIWEDTVLHFSVDDISSLNSRLRSYKLEFFFILKKKILSCVKWFGFEYKVLISAKIVIRLRLSFIFLKLKWNFLNTASLNMDFRAIIMLLAFADFELIWVWQWIMCVLFQESCTCPALNHWLFL